MNRRFNHRLAILFLWLMPPGAALAQDAGPVDLQWRPDVCQATVGDLIVLDLYAVTNDGQQHEVGAVDAILAWDPHVLELVGYEHQPDDYEWFWDGFFPDIYCDGINDTWEDGDAFYQALAQLPYDCRPTATPRGLRIVSFVFEVLAPTEGTEICVLPSIGDWTESRVLGTEFVGQVLTGDLGAATVEAGVPPPAPSPAPRSLTDPPDSGLEP